MLAVPESPMLYFALRKRKWTERSSRPVPLLSLLRGWKTDPGEDSDGLPMPVFPAPRTVSRPWSWSRRS